jgi:hypothetical protein
MRKLSLASVIILSCFVLSFACRTQDAQSGGAQGQDALTLVVEPGEEWQGKMKIFLFNVKKSPQLASWIETEEGRYVGAITVTSRSAEKKWKSSPKDGRPEALPVWNHRQNHAAQNGVDTVSTPTPKGPVEAAIDGSLMAEGAAYNIYLEVNHSFDYNDFWTEGNSGVNGQPSLIYHARFTAGQKERITLAPIGHGSVDGSDGNITRGLENITSALGIVKEAYVLR